MIEPTGPGSPRRAPATVTLPFRPGVLLASVLASALAGGAVAAGVTLGILHLQARTNPQRVDLGSAVTIREEDATTGVADKAAPAVVSIVTRDSSLAHGSGFLVTSDGFLVTSVGVVAGAQALDVLIGPDGRRHDARLVDYDCGTGMAVLKVDQVSSLPTLAFGDSSSLRLGQTVIVRGGPVNDGHGVAHGVLSGLHGTVLVDGAAGGGEQQVSDVIQTDTEIDPELSGAPLLDVGGQVVGVTVTAVSHGRQIGFALPASDLLPEVEEVIASGHLIVPSLGAQALDVSAEAATVRGGTAGARVSGVDVGGPAERAGLRAGDVITQLDDQRIDDAHPLAQVLRARFRPDQRVTVSYTRAGAGAQVQLTLIGDHPSCP